MSTTAQRVIGLEGGATSSEWVYLEAREGQTRRLDGGTLPAANFKLISAETLTRLLASLPREATHVGLFLAGCGRPQDQQAVRELARTVWPDAILVVGADRDSGFAAAFGAGDGIIVISGSGSAVHGRRGGRVERAGGWGQLLGDRGSGFDIGLLGLRHCLRTFDVENRTLPLATAFLRELGLNSLPELVDWAQAADKLAVARLAPAVFVAAREKDSDIGIIIEVCARRLAEYAWAVARRLEFEAPPVRLWGGVFRNNPEYVQLFTGELEKWLPSAEVELCTGSGAMGAAWLAAEGETARLSSAIDEDLPETGRLAGAATEEFHPASADLDELGAEELVKLFVLEEAVVAEVLGACTSELCAALELVHAALESGGRLFYVGAGTSGRLGILDASEIPPTFGVSPDLVQGIIAGGFRAMYRAVEGAEDSREAGRFAMEYRGVTSSDVVCGITASGYTPFVLGALQSARTLGAGTVLLTCNPRREGHGEWDVEIDLPTGAELIAGSTRLKAGTATKVALNIISTATMIRLGKVKGNLMIDLNASSAKLRDRATRIVSRLRGCSYEEARSRLVAHDWKIRDCLADC